MSLAMVEAAMLSASTGTRISVDALLEESYSQAVLTERDPDVLEVLKSWTSVRSALTPPAHQPTNPTDPRRSRPN
jgi:hypothetical protein